MRWARRRQSTGYAEEQGNIEAWMQAMMSSLKRAPSFAAALAELPRVLKGYGDTHERGKRAYQAIISKLVPPAVHAGFHGLFVRPKTSLSV